MASRNKFFSSSIGRKFFMALSALFLVIFLLIHVVINLLSLFGEEPFNTTSEFMGTNPLIQFVMQPVLVFAVVYHFVMGFVLEIQNRRARGNIKYAKQNAAANATWMSRNMIYSGGVILLFLVLHFFDFWFPTLDAHYFNPEHINYHAELVEQFQNPVRVVIYVFAFVLLALHLMHGFQSAFLSVGVNHKRYTPLIKKIGTIYAVLIPMLFIIIALKHYFF